MLVPGFFCAVDCICLFEDPGVQLGVSTNRGTPKSSGGTPIFGNTHIYIFINTPTHSRNPSPPTIALES